ncbi:MAG: hypothetical protein IJI01_14160 [Butyrivibrio sp.]|uniref:hypothetical protein n=1 Tax=Butyrivibrio sp. TaxID=28121 RepID=UPI0025C15AC7|nr:hypothetical protein [Butyrivibrio sp.]MBQ6589805.1 hypothetical protein [Butyrivibrio sp.]
MKKLKKHVVIGTTAGLAGLFLTACGAYGPPITESTSNTEGASMEIGANQETTQNAQDTPAAESSTASAEANTTEPVTDSASTESAAASTESTNSDAATGKISFSKVGEVKGEDAKNAMNSSSLLSDDVEYIDPKTIPVPAVYGPPVESK